MSGAVPRQETADGDRYSGISESHLVRVTCKLVERCKLPDVPVTVTVDVPTGLVASVVSFNCTVAGVLPGVTVEVENLHFAPFGRPKQVRETGKSKLPPKGCTAMLTITELPVLSVTEEGEAESA